MALERITIGFSTTNKWMSGVIRWITRSPVSHAWVGFYNPTLGLDLVFQAEAWGVELRPRKRWEKENLARAEFDAIRDPEGEQLRALIEETLGAKYDWRSAGLVGWLGGMRRWLLRWIRGGLRLRLSQTPSKLMCAELVVRYLQRLGFVMTFDPEATSPLDLLRWAQKGGLPMKWRHESVTL
jgi:hypothetical protein